ncbi:MAG TPA: asparaginase [Gemmatimonadaceae bacterium]|nr:asparaginase [Gemmatimonadaceae bacterium]
MKPIVAVTVLSLAFGQSASAQQAAVARPSLPRLLVIATGGTIAGVQDAPGTTAQYHPGTLTAEQILASVPQVAQYAEVESQQFSNVQSAFITPAQWVALARSIDEALRRPDLTGVIVTHGTDRLEETAFFLYLTVRSEKPVILVGAQRPATGISADGPINLLAAVRTAVSPQAVGKGVMIVMDDRIISAREVRKQYPRVGGFAGGEMGMLGVVGPNGPEFFFAPTRRRGPTSEFNLAGVSALPEVDLVLAYPGGVGRSFERKPAGVVVSAPALTCAETAAYQTLARTGVIIATGFPSGDDLGDERKTSDGVPFGLRQDCPALDTAGLFRAPWVSAIPVQHLTPQKARILLMLALTRTRDPAEILRYFNTY